MHLLTGKVLGRGEANFVCCSATCGVWFSLDSASVLTASSKFQTLTKLGTVLPLLLIKDVVDSHNDIDS